MDKILLVGIGGSFGAIARYGVYQLSKASLTSAFPVPTLVINLAGCLLAGIFFESMRDHQWFSTLSLFFAMGFLGSFTTFSTFGLETFQLMRNGDIALALLNVGANTVLGLGAVALGTWIVSILK
ncbi:MAG: fluoride efflux transporter CrcB [Proteobacteria bacterium]|nr:fluoride efflux transporter CrcB [Pseudomonadota bacterium]